ncbi:MAG: anthranilate synthase component I family protein [Sphingobacteriales bacterium]|nr:MAG: anthranilate synthase component I family protein [Sphingobacteriales bacterium]
MQRQIAEYPIARGQYNELKNRMLNWVNRFSILLFLDSNGYTDKYGHYELLVGAGAVGEVKDSLEALQEAHNMRKDWYFGNIGYDYKNQLESRLSSARESRHVFPELYFFRPQIVCYVDKAKTTLHIETLIVDPEEIYHDIIATSPDVVNELPQVEWQHRIDKPTYLQTIDTLREHIRNGDCYEINYCTEGYAEEVRLQPIHVFRSLNELSPAPFAAFYRNNEAYMMCASPERYIRKQGDKITSQPIKGTARRDADASKDEQIKTGLQQNIKERAENVMIVDLVRNDLARCCEVGSVQVDELFGIYTFPQVHQMISTVSGTLTQQACFSDAIRYSFPMGSMTGAPKVKVMELIEQYEHSRRELFAGTVCYITPNGDFDLNVIIRSIFYNGFTGYLSYQTGGAITYGSIAEQEYEEMRLKAWALESVFEQA